MFKYQLLIFLRNFRKSKTISFINVTGLAIGMAACITIFNFVQFETSYNSDFSKRDQIFRLVWKYGKNQHTTRLLPLVGDVAKEQISGISSRTRFFSQAGNVNLTDEPEKAFSESEILYTDNSFFDIFDYQLVSGKNNSFYQPYSAVLSPQTATRYFGDSNPIGKVITVSNMFGTLDYTVVDVVVEMPENSSIRFDLLLSNERLFNQEISYMGIQNWGAFETFLLIDKEKDVNLVTQSLNELLQEIRSESEEEILLQSVNDIHLYSGFIDGNSDRITRVYIFSAIAIVILLLAWFNYINLNISKTFERAKEVGVKKIFGSRNHQIISQFLTETLLLNIMALLLAIVVSQLISDLLFNFAGIETALIKDWNIYLLISFILVLILGAIFSGLAPDGS